METTVLKKRGNEALIKIQKDVKFGDKICKSTRYEWWYDINKMKEGITEEKINGEQYIYCSGFSGIKEEELLKMFDEAEGKIK